MSTPSVETMKKWLKDVMEVERRILVVDDAISSLDTKIKSAGSTNPFIKEPFKKNYHFYHGESIQGSALFIAIFVFVFLIFMGEYIFDEQPSLLKCFGITCIVVGAFYLLSVVRGQVKNNAKYREEMRQYNKLVEQDRARANGELAAVPVLKKERSELLGVRDSLIKTRSKLYCTYYLADEYRGFVPVSTMYGYLTSGRCTTIYGHGGIIDTFVHDSQFALLNSKLDTIITQLEDIQSTQRELATALNTLISEQRLLREDVNRFAAQSHADAERIVECQRYQTDCMIFLSAIAMHEYARR